MRRCVALALLLLLVGQSSGTALAAEPSPSRAGINLLAAVVKPIRSAIASSGVYAIVTGTEDRYAAMHAPAAVITRPITPIEQSPSRREKYVLRPVIRKGIRRVSTLPTRSELDVRHRHPDPLAMRRSRVASTRNVSIASIPSGQAPTLIEPSRNSPRSHRLPANRGPRIKPLSASNAGAGLEPWWTYSGRGIPGIGRAMVNVGTGNLLVSAADVDIPERGVDLTFQRVYNSQSLHDVFGRDGGQPAIFGNFWTNTLDANIVYSDTQNTITVYDVDGAPCTYTADGYGNWVPCPGVHATLAPTNPSDCNYAWTQPNGVIYVFETDNAIGGCSLQHAVIGHLVQIIGRNANNTITLTYSYYQGGAGSENITEIDATHSDGHTLVLQFGVLPNAAINELATITGPHGTTLQYFYDSYGNLTRVDKPGNNSASSFPSPPQGQATPPPGDVSETYSSSGGGPSPMTEACGPRCTAATWANQQDGANLAFAYNDSEQLTKLQVQGILNFEPSDGTTTWLQPGLPHGSQTWSTESFVYGNGNACTNASSGTTTMCDSDGHSTIWTIDGSSRVTQTQVATNASGSSDVVTTNTWDGNNDLTAYQTPPEFASGASTNLSYDSSGDLTKVQYPQVQTSEGKLRPTFTFSYDSLYNLLSSCDAVYNATNNGNCPTSSGQGSAVFLYDTAAPDSAEPFGKITDTYSPNDYHRQYNYNYNSSNEPGDFGLPTSIVGDQISELDQNQFKPEQDFTYDGYGNVTAYKRGNGAWAITYDNLNRPTVKADPDGISSYTCYFADNSIEAQQSALQNKKDSGQRCGSHSDSYLYDTDGNATDEINDFGGETGDTTKWYDGLDRLVDVKVPADINTDGNTFLRVRYLYDLTQNAGGAPNLQVGNSNMFHGYGDLYKTQRHFGGNYGTNPAWTDVNGNAFDPANRPIHRYQYTPTTKASGTNAGHSPGPLETWTFNYDEDNASGLLTSVDDPSGLQTVTYAYNAIANLASKTFSDSTPTDSYTYDPDGHLSTAQNSVASDSYIYDSDGNVLSDTEGTLGDPATLTYSYYPNDWRETLAVSDPSASFSTKFSYSYRKDGLRETLAVKNQNNPFAWAYTSAGRESSQTDPATGSGPFSGGDISGVNINAKSETYDSTTGMLSQLTMPDGLSYSNFTYDPEGDPTAFQLSGLAAKIKDWPNDTLVTGVQYGYDVRGELYLTQATGNGRILGSGATIEQDQFNFSHRECLSALGGCNGCGLNCNGQPGPDGSIDGNTGAAVTLSGGKTSQGCNIGHAISYDSNAREVSDIETEGETYSCTPYTFVADTRSYDAEDHVVTDTTANSNVYSWGPRGELRHYTDSVGSISTKFTLHWDGDNVVLTTNQGSVVNFYVEKLAMSGSASGRLTMNDRDFSGTSVEAHNDQGDSGVTVIPSYTIPTGKYTIANVTGTYPASGSDPSLDSATPRLDGYHFGSLDIQGVRAYDGNLSQWITPDGYKGDVDDPMSEWEYQWRQ